MSTAVIELFFRREVNLELYSRWVYKLNMVISLFYLQILKCEH